MTISRYKGQPLPIVVTFPSNPLAPYGKTYDDIEVISMNLKLHLATDEDDRYIEKKSTNGGVTLDEENHKFTMLMNEDSYDYLIVNTTYRLTLNVKVAGITDYIELDIVDRKVAILPDTNRE